MNTKRQLALGLFFLIAVATLGYFTLFLTDFKFFGERAEMTVHFSETNGLREGDPVLVAGMRWGKVEALAFDPNADMQERIKVRFSLDQPITLHENFSILVKDATLLGGKNLSIEPGTAGLPVVPGSTQLFGAVSGNVLGELSDVVGENREALRNTLAGIEAIVEDLRAGQGVIGLLLADDGLATEISQAVTDLAATVKDARSIASDVRAGQGTIGKLFVNEALYVEVEKAFDQLNGLFTDARQVVIEARGAVEDVRTGSGAIGRLINDKAIAQDIADSARNLRETTGRLNQGDGTIGRLINDDAIARNIEQITQSLAAGEGTLGKLLVENEVYENTRRLTEDLAATTDAIRHGEGTISKLVFDDDLYQELRRALGTLTGSLEEAREAAPISTFLNTVFLGF